MDLALTMDKIYELPNEVINISNEYNEFSQLLSDFICNQYNIKELKNKILVMFDKFNNVKFYFNIPIENLTTQSKTFEQEKIMNKSNVISITDKVVSSKIDSMIWAEDFYNLILSISKGLTYSEAIYLSYGVMGSNTEEVISERLKITSRTLQKIKKSCLVKLWSGLEALYVNEI